MVTPQGLLGASKHRSVSGRLSPSVSPNLKLQGRGSPSYLRAGRGRVGPRLIGIIGRPFPPGMCVLSQKKQKLPTVSWGKKRGDASMGKLSSPSPP